MRQETVKADFHKAWREDVEQEAADKFMGGECDGFRFILFSIPYGEGNFSVVDAFDPMVGNGDPMRIASEIFKDVFGAAEGALEVDVPFLFLGGVEQSFECGRFAEIFDLSMKFQLPIRESFHDVVAIFSGKDVFEGGNGKQKIFSRGAYEFIPLHNARWNDDVQMKMIHQVLRPGV